MSTETLTAPAPTTTAPQSPPGLDSWMKGLGEIAPAPEAPKAPETAIAAPPSAPKQPEPPKAPEAPKEAVKEPAAPTTETEEDKWPRSASDWDKFKAKRKERESALAEKVKTLEAKTKEYEEKIAKGAPVEDLEPLKAKLTEKEKELEEYSNRLRLIAVEKHPKFEAYFSGKTNAQLELAKRLVGSELADSLAETLKLPDSAYKDTKLEELTANLSPLKQSQLGAVLTTLSQIDLERQTEISKARENYEKMRGEEASQAEQSKKQTQAGLEKTFADISAKAMDAKDGLFVFQKREGDADWNKQVDQRLEVAKALMFGNGKPEHVAQAAFYAAATPAVLQAYVTLEQSSKATIAKLEGQVKALTVAAPTIKNGDTKQPEGDNPAPQIKPGSNPMEAAAAWMKGLGPLR